MMDKNNKDYGFKEVVPGFLILIGILGIAILVIVKTLHFLKGLL